MKQLPIYKNGKFFAFTQIDDEDYDKCIGKIWRVIGTSEHQYAYFWEGKKVNRMHNFVLGREASRALVVDHINRNPLDNQKSNLRICSVRENNCNTHVRRGETTSKYLGVYRQERNGKKVNRWNARIMVNRNQISDYGYLLEKGAAHAYDNMARKHHGEFANLNFPNEFVVPEKYKPQAGHKHIVLRKKPAYTSYIVQLHAIKNEKGHAYIKCFSILEEAVAHRNEKLAEYNIPIPD